MTGALDALADDLATKVIARVGPELVAAATRADVPVLAVTLHTAALRLGLSDSTVRRLIRDGRLDTLPGIARGIHVTTASLYAYAGQPLRPTLAEPVRTAS